MSVPLVSLNIYTYTFTVKVAHTGVQLQAVRGVTLSQELVTCKLAHTYMGPYHALWGKRKVLVHNILIHHPAEGEGGVKALWKESQTLRETISKEMNKVGAAAWIIRVVCVQNCK